MFALSVIFVLFSCILGMIWAYYNWNVIKNIDLIHGDDGEVDKAK